MSAPKKLDAQTETQVVAMIARGDTHQRIVDWLEEDKGIKLSLKTVSLIKSRNKESLDFMNKELVKHEATMAGTILTKSRVLIDKKLNRMMDLEKELEEIRKEFDEGEITAEEYYRRADVALRNQISVKELNALTKESFNQSQIEAGKPTGIVESPAQAKANLETLLDAIAKGDQQAMLKTIFPDA